MSFHMSLPLDFLLQLILLNLKCFLFGFNPQSFTLFSALSYHLDQSPGLIILRHYLVNKLIRLHLSFYEAPKKKKKQTMQPLFMRPCLSLCSVSSLICQLKFLKLSGLTRGNWCSYPSPIYNTDSRCAVTERQSDWSGASEDSLCLCKYIHTRGTYSTCIFLP